MIRTFFIFICFIFISLLSSAQDFGVGSWREHLPYNNVINVAKIDGKCYAVTHFGAYYFDEDDNSVNRLSKLDGLSDFSITSMGVNHNTQMVVIAYENGNLDLIQDGQISNLNAILVSNIVGDKSVYSMYEYGDLLYLSCGFGIVVLDTKQKEIKDTYKIGPGGSQIKINDITIFRDSIYAASNQGVQRAALNTPFLADYTQWLTVPLVTQGFPIDILHSNDAYLSYAIDVPGYNSDSLYIVDAQLQPVASMGGDDYYDIQSKEDRFIISRNLAVAEYDMQLNEYDILYTYAGNISLQPNVCVWQDDAFWIGDKNYGLNKSLTNWQTTNLGLSGPQSNDCFTLTADNGNLWVATGSVTGTGWNNSYSSKGIYKFNGEGWSVFDRFRFPGMNSDSIFDYVHLSVDPLDDDHIFMSTFFGGLLEFDGETFVKRHTYHNSAIQTSFLHPNNQVKVSSSVVDRDGNCWVANSYVGEPLVLLTPDGNSYSFNCGATGSSALITDIHYSENWGYIVMSFFGQGVLIYDINDTPTDPSDDSYKYLGLNEGSGNLPSTEVNRIAEDLDGEFWFGTGKGPAVLFSPPSVFQSGSNGDAQQILLLQDGSYQLLLEDQAVSSIAVDGANRKWLGTSSGGVFLMSEDGTEQIFAFDADNSPLLSNSIRDIDIESKTGEVFFGTDKGIIGYKSTALEAEGAFNDVYAYPNPVREYYTGPIAIKGLMKDSDVKITDASGNLVFSTTSLGGQAIWDGNTLQGERVATGVYFVFAVSQDGFSKTSTKILVIN